MNNTTNKSNFLQRFFWYCATADRTILEQCGPKEKTKHTLIGTFVFITSLFATVTGAYAVSFVNDSFGITEILVGLLWGFLIFSFDRLLISTIKISKPAGRDTTSTVIPNGQIAASKKWYQRINIKLPKINFSKIGDNIKRYTFLIFRIVLAILISFVITTPLELNLYKEQIDVQIKRNYRKGLKEAEGDFKGIYNIEDLEKQEAKFDEERAELQEEKATLEMDSLYRKYDTDHKKCYASYKNYQRRLRGQINDNNKNIKWIQSFGNPRYYVIINDKKQLTKEARREINSLRKKNRSMQNQIKKRKENCELIWGQRKQRKIELDAQKAFLDSTIAIANRRALETSNLLDTQRLKKTRDLMAEGSELEQEGIGLFAKINAMHDYVYDPQHPERKMAHYLLLGIFMLIETLPVVAKTFSAYGEYEEIDETMRLESYLAQKAKRETLQKQMALTKKKIELQIDNEMTQLDKTKNWNNQMIEMQMRIVEKAFEAWADTEVQRIQGRKQVKYEDYVDVEDEV